MFYFLEYAVRSSPSVMIPELANAFGITALGVSAILGVYCYTYSTVSLVVGAALDRLGGKRSILCSDPRSRMSVVTHYLPRSQEAITAFEARSPD
jgi:MFS family permease